MARFSRSEHKELTRAVKLFNEKIPELKKQGIYKDYRLPENREECFNRYFGYRVTTYDLDHTHYLTVLSEGYSDERKAWLALLFGMTYRTPQAFAYAETFDNPNDIDLKELDIWHDENYHRCTYGTDARYNKGKFHLQIRSMKEWLGNMTVLEKIHSIIDNPELKTDFDRFKALYSSINTMYRFGRMTGWLALQGLYDLLKLPIDPHQILIEGYNPSKDASLGSIWNGLCMLKNMPEKLLSQYGNYKCTPEDLVWGEKELVEAVRKAQEYNGLYDIDSFRLESIYCQYKRMYHEGMSFEYPGHACFPAGTKIKMLDGTVSNIEDLVGVENFWVYSCTPEGKIVAGLGHSAHITKYVTELAEVTLDNGKVIKCTTDHRFMLRNGEYKEAKDLTVGESLMPLYVTDDEYPKVIDNYSSKLEDLHRLIARRSHGLQYEETLVRAKEKGHTSVVVHHENKNPRDNTPPNLRWLTGGEHLAIHREEFQTSETGRKLMSEWGSKSGNKPESVERLNAYATSEKGRQTSRVLMNKLHSDPKFNKECGERGAAVFKEKWNNDQEWAQRVKDAGSKTLTKINKDPEVRKNQLRGMCVKSAKHVLSLGLELNEENYNSNRLAHSVPRFDYALSLLESVENLKSAAESYNHQVVSVKIVKCESQPVYDITVDEHHNFALDAGVFVHNSGDATSRYLFYREHWPEIDWSKFRRALRTQPGILKGQTFVPWKNQFFGQTGALMSVHERFEDMPDIWDICELDPQQYLVKELWTDDNLPVPTSLELRTSYWKDLETAPKYWKEK